MLILLICGEIEPNLGPSRSYFCYIMLHYSAVYHWNLNSMTAHNFKKINIHKAYNTINKFDVICLLESYLDSYIASDNDDLNIKN